MREVDLGRFQFDYDLPWAAVFLRPDGTVYARYDGRVDGRLSTGASFDGLRVVLERVLAAHAAWPEDAARFAAKAGPPPAARSARELDAQVMRDALGSEGPHSCIHCHHVHDALNEIAAREPDYDPARLVRHPEPESLGLTMNPRRGTKVSTVAADSPAARAGLRPGDELLDLADQAILSLADLRFALHHLEDAARPAVRWRRGQRALEGVLALEPGWKRGDLSWRASMFGMPPKPGLWLGKVPKARRAELGLRDDALALQVRGLFGAAVKRADLEVGDVVVAADDHRDGWTPEEFHAWLRRTHWRAGDTLRLEVVRGAARRTVSVTF